MKNSIRRWLLFGVAACGLAGLASPGTARAGFLSGFTGNTQMSDGTAVGVISFSVFETSAPGANWINELNSALSLSGAAALKASTPNAGGVDATARYVYMYQVVNTGATDALENLKVANPASFTSAGNLLNSAANPSSVVFEDTNGQVKTTNGNIGLGKNPSADDIVNGVPSTSGATVSTISALNTAVRADSTDLDFGGNSGFVQFNFQRPVIGVAKVSTIVFLTSDHGPYYARGLVRDGSNSDGDIPTAVAPEPGSLTIAAIGLCGLGTFYRRRRA